MAARRQADGRARRTDSLGDLGPRFHDGDLHALHAVVTQVGTSLIGTLKRRHPGAQWHDLEDCVSVTIWAAWRRRGSFESRGPLSAWLLTIAERRLATTHRSGFGKQRAREVGVETDTLAQLAVLPGLFGGDAGAESSAVVRQAIGALAEKERRLVDADLQSTVGRAPAADLGAELGFRLGRSARFGLGLTGTCARRSIDSATNRRGFGGMAMPPGGGDSPSGDRSHGS